MTDEKEIEMKCSANQFFVCWTKNFVLHAEEKGKAKALAEMAQRFVKNPVLFQDMMADGFCHCDGTCK